MARGKCAAQAANRRARAVEDRYQEIQAELKAARDLHAAEKSDLQAKLVELSSEIKDLAGEMAARDIARMSARLDEADRNVAIAGELTRGSMEKMDKLMLNACRYLSMTKGEKPLAVLPLVVAWATDEDVYGLADEPSKILVHLGVRHDGWVSQCLKTLARNMEQRNEPKRRENGTPLAWKLDHAESNSEDFSQIHPDYRTSWYPRVRDKTKLVSSKAGSND